LPSLWQPSKGSMNWFVYIIEASDNSLYTGITTDLERRFHQHASGKGAKYFNGRSPVKFVYNERADTRTDLERRFHQHASGKGAKYFNGRSPVKFVYNERADSRSSASIREAEIKKLTRVQKQQLIDA